MGFTSALYYPWIEIQDEHWLRTACLYWEHLQTIVPASLRRPYRGAASQELFDTGILEPLRVESGLPEVEALFPDIASYVQSQEATELLLGRAPGYRASIHLDKLPAGIRRLTRIHPDKLPYELRHILQGSRTSRGGWLHVTPEFADFYMTLLATRLAEQRALGLLTPSFTADRLANSVRAGSRSWNVTTHGMPYTSRRVPASRELIEGLLVDLVIGGFSISPDVPLKKILTFRRSHEDELGRLRTQIGALAASVPEKATPLAIRQRAQDIVTNEVAPALADLRAALKGSRIKTLTEGLLKVSFLSAAPTSGLVLAGLAAPTAIAVGAGISLTATAALLSVEKERTLRDNPFAYLLAVEKKFA